VHKFAVLDASRGLDTVRFLTLLCGTAADSDL
jgi:hypothetical protein